MREQAIIAGSDFSPVCATLTYDPKNVFGARDITRFLDRLRSYLKHRGCPNLMYIWVLEISPKKSEGDGIVHFHLLLWLPNGLGRIPPGLISRWWPHGSTWARYCRDFAEKGGGPGAWVRYMAKFNSPAELLPRGARTHGIGGLTKRARIAVARAGWPVWLQKLIPEGECAVRRPGIGWLHLETGEILVSPYVWTPKGPRPRETLPLFAST